MVFSFNGHAQENWRLKKDRNGVKIYSRDYPNSKFKEYKAIMVVKTSLQEVKAIVLDADNLKNWNYKTSKSKLVKKIDENKFIFYLFNDMPWPVLNRDHVSDVAVTYPNDKSIRINISPNNDILPENKGTVRITNFKGFWLLEETSKGISITHQLFGDPEGGVPAWLVNSQLVKSPYTSFNNLKDLLENKDN
ncbi:MAG: lipid-binding protein [Flavobacteriaceae bacterium]|nr:lipid-binding protein [Bacteroidia bacterium]NNL59856.1 lipid-binding protein [Flavobacteriaceae bacterium]